jgi:hypothetical protein
MALILVAALERRFSSASMTSESDSSFPVPERDLIPFEDVPALLPTRRGRKRHKSAVYRWADEGIEGVRLRYLQVAGQKCTTRRWLMEFFTDITAKKQTRAPETSGNRTGERASQTERILKRSNLQRRR